jgi:enolase-phosphatase E1
LSVDLSRFALLDIEGTTTPISFVYDVLFPYARQRLEPFLRKHWDEEATQADLGALREENRQDAAHGAPPIYDASEGTVLEHTVAYLDWLMDRDRKSRPLKSLQGRIWQVGFAAGELKSQVFPDVPSAFANWRKRGRQIAIYSSGSVLAQQQLFEHVDGVGDLSGFISHWFDTRVGPKRESASYTGIAAELRVRPDDVLFISDVTAELDAAKQAGLNTRLALRLGNAEQPPSAHETIKSFDEI